MKALRHILVLSSFFTFLLFSCNSDDEGDVISDTGPDFSISDLVGTWNATDLVFTYSGDAPIPDPSFYDLIAEGGTASVTVQSNGRFTLTVNPAGFNSETFSGLMYFEDGEFFAIQFDDDPPDDPTYFGESLVGDIFTLNGGPDTAEWDFDDDGNDDPASVFLRFVKV
ncbi:MAG: hypothetical protein ACR2MM_02830 [Flavobacteriaceae bacterium]